MTISFDILQFAIYLGVLTLLSVYLGKLFYSGLMGDHNILTPILGRIEKAVYKLASINPEKEMYWNSYLGCIFSLSIISLIIVMLVQIIQVYLPLNPEHLPNVEIWLAFNTAASFVTNTNWQSYAGEVTLSYFVQMFCLTVQNFLTPAVGLCVLLVLTRSLIRRKGNTVGNFWVDLTRSILYVLIPLSIILSIILMGEGVVQTFSPYKTVITIEGAEQIVPLGPVASQVAIKQLGTNGGGFYSANSAFPLENPTQLSNFLEMLSILIIPGALIFTYGRMLKSKKHAWTIYYVTIFLFISAVIISYYSEVAMSSSLKTSQLLEGKETRFGVFNSILWSVATTSASNGSVNAMHSSLSPISGLITILMMALGEVVFGGVGSGLYGMILFIFLTVFLAGLMIGRTPEYFGKKIEAYEIKWTIFSLILPTILALIFTALGIFTDAGHKSILSPGPHGFSEVLYAFTSGVNNNGSAFSGLNANTPFYNIVNGIGMLVGRFAIIAAVMTIAGNLVQKNIAPESAGTLSVSSLLFGFLLTSVILIVGALAYLPAFTLGPILEQLLLESGRFF